MRRFTVLLIGRARQAAFSAKANRGARPIVDLAAGCARYVILLFAVGAILMFGPAAARAGDPTAYDIRWAASTPVKDLPAGYLAENPAHGFNAWIAPDGLRVRPRDGDWEFGLELLRVGRKGAMADVEPGGVKARGNRAELAGGPVVEWHENDERGLEQGFTISKRPASDNTRPALNREISISPGHTSAFTQSNRPSLTSLTLTRNDPLLLIKSRPPYSDPSSRTQPRPRLLRCRVKVAKRRRETFTRWHRSQN